MSSEAHLLMAHYLTELGVGFKTEYRFHEERKWRFDFAVPEHRVAVEIEGGIYVQGRHNRGKGYQSDLDKYNAATACGWRVFRFSTQDVKSCKAKETIGNALGHVKSVADAVWPVRETR